MCSVPLPLKLVWTVTIHKSQGLTLDKVVIDIRKKEFSCQLTYMACSRVQQLTDLLFSLSFPFQQLSCRANNQHLHDCGNQRIRECLQCSHHLHIALRLHPMTSHPCCHPSLLWILYHPHPHRPLLIHPHHPLCLLWTTLGEHHHRLLLVHPHDPLCLLWITLCAHHHHFLLVHLQHPFCYL